MMENFISQMGTAPKQVGERYAEYPAIHDQHFYYAYEPAHSSHGHASSSKHQYSGGHKSNAAMSALTLLAFLFFLHILQQCLRDHMTAMSTPQVMIMSAGKEGEENIAKITRVKTDKTGISDEPNANTEGEDIMELPFDEKRLMKIPTSEHEPQNNMQMFKNSHKTTVSGYRQSPYNKK